MSALNSPALSKAGQRAIIVRALLALIMLAPVTMLFVQVWQTESTNTRSASMELDAIAYLRVLQPVLTTLAQNESLVVSQEQVVFNAMDQAMSAAGQADAKYGDELRTHERWNGFATKANALPALGNASPIDSFNAYSAVTDLLLSLYDKVRDESGLVRDPDADVFYLEDAATHALPNAVSAAGQYGDSIVVEFGPASGIAAARVNVSTDRALLDLNADDVGDDVSDAVDATASRSMSSTLLHKVDLFRQAIETLAPTRLAPVTTPSDSDESAALQNKAETEAAAASLSSALLDAIETLVTDRGAAARHKQDLSLAAFVVAILIVALLITAEIRRGLFRRTKKRPVADRPDASNAPEPDDLVVIGAHAAPRDPRRDFVFTGRDEQGRSGVPQ
jgi:hypothetical protein